MNDASVEKQKGIPTHHFIHTVQTCSYGVRNTRREEDISQRIKPKISPRDFQAVRHASTRRKLHAHSPETHIVFI